MTKYEIMYIIRPTLEEETRKALIEEISNIFTARNSEVHKVNEWGMRELAYEIQKFTKGYYVVMEITANNEACDEFNRVIRLKEDIIRFLMIKDVR